MSLIQLTLSSWVDPAGIRRIVLVSHEKCTEGSCNHDPARPHEVLVYSVGDETPIKVHFETEPAARAWALRLALKVEV